jgi:hypothetical protein
MLQKSYVRFPLQACTYFLVSVLHGPSLASMFNICTAAILTTILVCRVCPYVYVCMCDTLPPQRLDGWYSYSVFKSLSVTGRCPVNTYIHIACEVLTASPCLLFHAGFLLHTLKMEATCASETSVDFQRTARRYIPENITVYEHFSSKNKGPPDGAPETKWQFSQNRV